MRCPLRARRSFPTFALSHRCDAVEGCSDMQLRLVAAMAGAFLLSACGLNSVPTAEEGAKAKWAEVQNQYQRRADLIPNLVSTVKAAGAQEKDILVQVTQARAAATQVQVTEGDLT